VSPLICSSGAVAAVGDTSRARTIGVAVVVAAAIAAIATASWTPTIELTRLKAEVFTRCIAFSPRRIGRGLTGLPWDESWAAPFEPADDDRPPRGTA
jgi:hypothetical protein